MRQQVALLAAWTLLVATHSAVAESVVYLGPDESSGASQAVVVEGHALVHTGQLLPLDKDGTLIGGDAADAQLAHLLFNLETALAAAGSSSEHLVKLNVYVDSASTAGKIRGLFSKRFPGPVRPAMSWVCTPLAHPEAVVALDAVAAVPGEGPAAVVGKRCEALAGNARLADLAVLPHGEAVYVSGMSAQGDLAAATAETIKGLMKTIGLLGLDGSHVVQVKAFMQPMGKADVVKRAIAGGFSNGPAPPVVLVEWTAKTPIEIELIAFVPPEKRAAPASQTVEYFTPPGVEASPVYSRVARVPGQKRVYTSGLYAEEPGDGAAQIRSIFSALDRITKEAGTDLRHLVKATYYVSDESAGEMLNKLRPEYYDPARPPAASKVTVANVGMAERSITMDMKGVGAE